MTSNKLFAKCLNFGLLCLFFVLLSGYLAPYSVNAGEPDFKKTISYVKRLEGRSDFPVSVTFSYYYLASLSLLGEKVPEDTKMKVVAFVLSSQNSDGGFSDGTSYSKNSSPVGTFYALNALREAGHLDKIRRDRAVHYLLGLQNRDGGFSFKRGGQSLISATYYCVMSLKELDAIDRLERESVRRYVMGLYDEKSGGFAIFPGMPGNLRATFWAATTLRAIGALDRPTSQRIADFFSKTRYSGRSNRRFVGPPKVDEAHMVYEALYHMGHLQVVDRARAIAFLKGLYIDFNGGFGPFPGYGSTHPSTFHALKALYYLGALETASKNRVGE